MSQEQQIPHAKFFDSVNEAKGQNSAPTMYGIEIEIPPRVRRWMEANGYKVFTAVMGNSFVTWD